MLGVRESSAKVRAAKALAGLVAARLHTRGFADLQPTPSTNAENKEEEEARQRARYAEENAERAKGALEFLSQADAFRSMIRMRTLTEPFRKLKSRVLRDSLSAESRRILEGGVPHVCVAAQGCAV